jgi:cyclophilin family peptidyl-prolyl cis-trans isomerase
MNKQLRANMHGSPMVKLKSTRSFFSVLCKCLLLVNLSLTSIASFAQSESSLNLAQQMYVAYYGRAGDPGGVNYWAGQFDESSNLDAVLSNFGNSQEYSDNFGSLSNEELVDGLFLQMFNRSSDAAGLEFYVGRLESGAATLASIAKQIVDGTQADDQVSLDNKVAVANAFTARVETEGLDYATADISVVRTLLAAVTSSTSTVDAALLEVASWEPESSQSTGSSNAFMTTNYGVIEIELYPEQAPITVANFLAYIEAEFYDNLIFHRVISGFMIQGGGFEITGAKKTTFAAIELETDNELSNVRGTIAMARTNVPDSATSQFFINHVDNLFLDATGADDGYAVFGTVVAGMDVVDAIANLPTVSSGGFADLPAEPVIIESVVLAQATVATAAAKAGADQNVNTFQAVYLNGAGSLSVEGSLTYTWSYLTGPSGAHVELYSSTNPTAYFTPDVAGRYTFELKVNDGSASISTDRIVINVSDLVF